MPVHFVLKHTAKFSVLDPVDLATVPAPARMVGGRRVGSAPKRSSSREPPKFPPLDLESDLFNDPNFIMELKSPGADDCTLASSSKGLALAHGGIATQKLQAHHLAEQQMQHSTGKSHRPTQQQNNRQLKATGQINQPRGQNH